MSETKENGQLPLRMPKLGLKRGFKTPGLSGQPSMRPLPPVQPAHNVGALPAAQDAAALHYFTVLYCKYQPAKKQRKNKSFSDGVLEVKPGNAAALYYSEGKVVSRATLRGYDAASVGNGSSVILGNWEVEVDAPLPPEQFLTGKFFLKACNNAAAAEAPPAADARPPKAPKLGAGFKLPSTASAAFKRPGGGGGAQPEQPKPAVCLHDPQADGAIVLNAAQWAQGTGRDDHGKTISPVVVDPYIGRQLRPHQVEGVRFLYECIMGARDPGRLGAILADAMGLGKTLTTLALLWTLLKQGPAGRPAVGKALIVTPSSLTRNWAEEARKWLGNERLSTMIIAPGAEGNQQVIEFRHGAVVRVGIISYETLRKHSAALAGSVGVVVADEGHRLKSAAGNKTISALVGLGCHRRVLLTGTPLQNNLSEFYAMCDVVNPDVLGTLPVFERVFGSPITRSRDRNATAEEKELGAERSRELARRVETFVLRRGAEVNAAYLPPLSLFVVFCRPTPLQVRLLQELLGSGTARRVLTGAGGDFGDQTLSVLTSLRKICNHPALHTASAGDDGDGSAPAEPPGAVSAAAGGKATGSKGGAAAAAVDVSQSGKLAALSLMLESIVEVEGGRCVVVSGSTAMLDLVSGMCAAKGYSTCRIDGSTDVDKRQDVVNAFNSYGVGQVFLLSTTAGGAGLNLTGANRLVLLDSHWNPAMDAQAMARVWRDGQRLPCIVYRLLTTGTLEEKVYQRQRAKGDIAAVTVGAGASGGGGGRGKGGAARGQFSREELRQLFTLRCDTACDTADVLAAGGVAAHAFADCSATCGDAPLEAAVAAGHVSFVHLEKKQGRELAAAAAVAGEGVEGGEEEGSGDAGGGGSALGGVSDLEVEDDF